MKKKKAKQTKKSKMISVKIPEAFLMDAPDYHDFQYFQEDLKEFLALDFKYEEVGSQYDYYAIFWIGKKPAEMIKEARKVYDEDCLEEE